MNDYLKDIIDFQKKSLEKYDNKNIRTKNVTFVPIDEENIKEEYFIAEELSKEYIQKQEVLEKSENPLNKKLSKKTETNSDEKETTGDFKNFLFNLSKKFDKDDAAKKQKDLEMYSKRKNLAEKKKVITKVYVYLFDCMYNYSLCFEEFREIVSKFPEFIKSIPEIKSESKKPNTRDFIYKIRTVSLLQKINIFAYQIGQYNFSLLVDNIPDLEIFSDYSVDELAIKVTTNYNGTDLDYLALLNLFDIAEADMNGSIVFEENVPKVEKKEEPIPVDKKEKRKKVLGFDTFNLKKN